MERDVTQLAATQEAKRGSTSSKSIIEISMNRVDQKFEEKER